MREGSWQNINIETNSCVYRVCTFGKMHLKGRVYVRGQIVEMCLVT